MKEKRIFLPPMMVNMTTADAEDPKTCSFLVAYVDWSLVFVFEK